MFPLATLARGEESAFSLASVLEARPSCRW